MPVNYTPGRTNFGLLPEPERSPGSFFTSIVINGTVLALAIYMGSMARMAIEHRYEETVLIVPLTPAPPAKAKLPEPPKIKAPEPPKLPDAQLEAPKIPVPRPEPKPDLKPIQIASFDFAEYAETRRKFTADEWIDLIIRTIGLEPAGMSKRLKMLYLMRMVPFCEQNYNLVELGPRETGKSFGYQQLSPYAILLTGPTTVANLFYNIATNRIGLVGLWDAVAFDEVADLQKMPKEVV